MFYSTIVIGDVLFIIDYFEDLYIDFTFAPEGHGSESERTIAARDDAHTHAD